MRKIENWEEIYKKADEVVEFDSIPVGPQICKIVKVEDIIDREYHKIYFDIADGEYKGFFKSAADRNNGEWSFQGIAYRSYKKSAEKFFAAFIKAVEKSNNNFVWNFDETKLVGKFFVANFGEEEYENDYGDIKVSNKCREIRSLRAFRDNEIKTLELKKLSVKEVKPEEPATNQPTYNQPTDDLPF